MHPIGIATQPSAKSTQPNGKVAQPSGTAQLNANATQLTGKVTQPQPSVVVLDTIDHKTNSSGNVTQPTVWSMHPSGNINYQMFSTVLEQNATNRLPIPEPGKFGGNPLEYPCWRHTFNTLIDRKVYLQV